MKKAIESIVRQAKRKIRKNIMRMYHNDVFENNLSSLGMIRKIARMSLHYVKMAQFILVILFLYKSLFLFFPDVFLSLGNLNNTLLHSKI